MKQTDTERLQTILHIWEELTQQIEERGITPDLLLKDAFTQWAVTTPLYNIGEQVYQISADFKNRYPDIPWNMVAGLRHRLVHNYEGINWSIIVEVVFHEMDDFIRQIAEIIS